MTNAVSAQGLALIQRHEGFRAEPAQLPDGNWVVGYGHVRAEAGEALSPAEAADLLSIDVAPFERLVNASVAQSLSQSQFDALVSFAFSVGADAFTQSQVLRRVNAGDIMAAACALDAWRKSDVGGEMEVVDVLVRRRAAEKALFLQDLAVEAAPSAFVRAKLDHAASILGAPVKFVAAPAVGSIPPAAPKGDNVVVLSAILKSEPATEVLLLTQVVPDDVVVEEDAEIVTAHAKPVARPLDNVREATRRAYAASEQDRKKGISFSSLLRRDAIEPASDIEADHRIADMRRRAERRPMVWSAENLGLLALLVFGFALLATAGSLMFTRGADMVEAAGAAALAAPGLAASLMAMFGLHRSPRAAKAGA